MKKAKENPSNATGYFLGFDTSCYTTSVALVDEERRIIKDLRRVLQVKAGERGLRQSEALFQHLKNLPDFVEKISPFQPLLGIAASSRPRPVDDSYLPVFLAGLNFARTIAAVTSLPLLYSSHQEGHIRAALEGSGLEGDEFLGLHLSGGTTELLYIKKKEVGFTIELLGGTTDLHAGQMVDRVGVALGLPFPAGPDLEKLAERGKPGIDLPVSVRGLELSFSGPTSAAFRLLQKQPEPADLALAVLNCLVESVFALIKEGIRVKTGAEGCQRVLVFGGVAANSYLRRELAAKLEQLSPAVQLGFGRIELSSDNAVGIALSARDLVIGGDQVCPHK